MNPGPSTGSDNRLPATVDASKRGAENSDQEPPRKHRPEPETDEDGRTALHRAAMDGDAEEVEALLEAGFDPGWKDDGGRTPLLLALLCEEEAAAEVLAEVYSPEDDEPDRLGPQHAAAVQGFVGVLGKMIAAGADTLLYDPWGWAPLHHALASGMDDAAEILMDAGGVGQKTRGGITPFSIAVACGSWETAKKLLLRGADPHLDPPRAASELYPLQFAVLKRREDVSKMIVSMCVWKGIELDFREVRLPRVPTKRLRRHLSECEAELRRMADARIPASCVSYRDVASRPARWVARYLENESVREAVQVDRLTANFPNYAELIEYRVRAADEWRVLADECEQYFSLLEQKCPITCSDAVPLYLGERDMRNFIGAFESRHRRNRW